MDTEIHPGCWGTAPGGSLEDSLLRKLSSLRAKPIHHFFTRASLMGFQTAFQLLQMNTSQSHSKPNKPHRKQDPTVAGVTLGAEETAKEPGEPQEDPQKERRGFSLLREECIKVKVQRIRKSPVKKENKIECGGGSGEAFAPQSPGGVTHQTTMSFGCGAPHSRPPATKTLENPWV